MCWVAIDRGLRLADKRCLPCPNRVKWLEVRDAIYEEIQEKGYNKELGFFSQVGFADVSTYPHVPTELRK